MTQKRNYFTIDIDWDSDDAGYSVLKSKKMVNYLLKNLARGNNMIQTYKPFTVHKTTLYLRAKRVKSWVDYPEWDKIGCKPDNEWIQSTPCTIGQNRKMFVKYKSNEHVAGFAIYLLMIMSGEISVEKHKQFVAVMQRTMDHVIIHNEDVDWLHLKQKLN